MKQPVRYSLLVSLIALFSNIIIITPALAAECSPTSGSVTVGANGCTDYLFTAGASSLILQSDSSANIGGIYFTGGTYTSISIYLNGGTFSGMIYATAATTFTGGTIQIKGVSASQIVFLGTMTGNVNIDIQHNTLTFNGDGTPPHSAVGSSLPTAGVLAFNPAAKFAVGFVRIMMNKITTTGSAASTIKAALNFASGTKGDASNSYFIIYGNQITCTLCREAGMNVQFLVASPTSTTQGYGASTNLTIEFNNVNTQYTLAASVSRFAACQFTGSAFIAGKLYILDNYCRFYTSPSASTGSIWMAYGLLMTVPPNVQFSYFGWSFDECGYSDDFQVLRNTGIAEPKNSAVTVGTTGIEIYGYMGVAHRFNDNVAKGMSLNSHSVGILLYPVCISLKAKFGMDFGLGCVFNPASCTFPQAAIRVSGNDVNATGANGAVYGLQFTQLSMRDNPPVFGNRVPVPVVYDMTLSGNTIGAHSTGNANRTRGVYIGDQINAQMPPKTTADSNTITVSCTGSASTDPTDGNSCEGYTFYTGLPTEYMVSLLQSFTALQRNEAAITDMTIRITCGVDGWQQCTGFNLALMPTMSRYPLTLTRVNIDQIETGNQAATVGTADRFQHSAPLSLARKDVVSSNPVLDMQTSISSSSFNLHRYFNAMSTETPLDYRANLRFDPKNRAKLQALPLTDISCELREYFTGVNAVAPSKIASLISVPYDSTSLTSITGSNIVTAQNSFCRDSVNQPWSSCSRGAKATPLRLNPAGTSATNVKLDFTNFVVQGRMSSTCVRYFNPPLTTSCPGCTLKIGCQKCAPVREGIIGTSSWTRTYDQCNLRTKSTTYQKPPPTRTRQLSDSDTVTISERITDSEPITPSKAKTRSRSLLDTETKTKPLPLPPTDTAELTVSTSLSHVLTPSQELSVTEGTPTFSSQRTKSKSKTRPACNPGLRLQTQIAGDLADKRPSARDVERRTVSILLRLVDSTGSQEGLGEQDALFSKNLTIYDIKVLSVADSEKLKIVSVTCLSFRIIQLQVQAPVDVNAFVSNVGARFEINPDVLNCVWTAMNSTALFSAPAFFNRRFGFTSPAATQALLGVGVFGTYFAALFFGSSGISQWFAVRRSIGFYDAVSCMQRPDSLLSVIDSPLQLRLGGGLDFDSDGTNQLSLGRGVVIGNAALVSIFALIVLGMTTRRSQSTWKPLFNNEAMGYIGAPALFLFPISSVLIPGTVNGALKMLTILPINSTARILDAIIAILLTLLVVATPLLIVARRILPRSGLQKHVVCLPVRLEPGAPIPSSLQWEEDNDTEGSKSPLQDEIEENSAFLAKTLLRNDRYSRGVGVRNNNMRSMNHHHQQNDSSDEDDEEEEINLGEVKKKSRTAEELKMLLNKKKRKLIKKLRKQPEPSLMQKLFTPLYFWKTISPSSRFFSRYATAFDRNHESVYYFTILDIIISFVAGIVSGLPVSRQSQACNAVIVVHILILIVGLAFSLLGPFSVRFDNFWLFLFYIFGLTNAIFGILINYKGDYSLEESADALVFIILICCVIKLAIDLWRCYSLEPKPWTLQRLSLLWERLNEDDSTKRKKLRKSRGGDDDDGDLAFEEMTPQEQQEELELRAIEREKLLKARTLPAPSRNEAGDLKAERKRRKKAVQPLINEGLFEGKDLKFGQGDDYDDDDLTSMNSFFSPPRNGGGTSSPSRAAQMMTFIRPPTSNSSSSNNHQTASAASPPGRVQRSGSVGSAVSAKNKGRSKQRVMSNDLSSPPAPPSQMRSLSQIGKSTVELDDDDDDENDDAKSTKSTRSNKKAKNLNVQNFKYKLL